MNHCEKARELFLSGYNCAQSVFTAFCDVTGMEEKAALRLSSSFGGGIGCAREVCGAVSAAAMVAGILNGYDTCDDLAEKKAHYARVTEILNRFRERNGTVVCRELLQGIKAKDTPSERTEEYYKERPCLRFVEDAAQILDEMLAEKKLG